MASVSKMPKKRFLAPFTAPVPKVEKSPLAIQCDNSDLHEKSFPYPPDKEAPDTPESMGPAMSPTEAKTLTGHANARMSACPTNHMLNGKKRSMKGKQRSKKVKSGDEEKKRKSSSSPSKRATDDRELESEDEIFIPILSVQCEKCRKWRRLSEGTDPSQLPDKWYCHMNPDLEYNSCETPEAHYDTDFDGDIEAPFTLGSLVWAKLERFPWWPAMIDNDPDSGTFFQTIDESTPEPIQYHITFIEDRASRAWLPFWELRQFHTDDVATSQGEVPNHYRRSIERAVRSASMLASMDLRERIRKQSFTTRYNPMKDLSIRREHESDETENDTSPEWKCSDSEADDGHSDDESDETPEEVNVKQVNEKPRNKRTRKPRKKRTKKPKERSQQKLPMPKTVKKH